ncbi:hypothetical protein [Xanthomonas tesorieronis]|uniref:hypothetical protein n=1 Tax=Xanthomonas tesorieronis TaxID=3160839 RepID=UPI003519BA86
MTGSTSFRPSTAAVFIHPCEREAGVKPMNSALKFVLIGSMVAALAACHRDGDKNAQDQNAATPPAAADGSPAGGSSAPVTSGDATGTSTGADPATAPATPATPTTDPQSPTTNPQQQQQPPADNQQHY